MKKQNAYVPFGAPRLDAGAIRVAVETLKSGWLTSGPRVKDFEAAVASYVGVEHAIAVHSCTAALHLSLVAAGVGEGDEVITVPLTFGSTLNVIVHVGATPVLVDVDRDSMNMDPEKLEAAITPKTKAIMPVHFAGRPCEMDAIRRIAKKHKLIVIEDAAHAIGASYRGTMVGAISDYTCFSFYAGKNIAVGEGGMVTTNSAKNADTIKLYSLHGMTKDAWNRYAKDGKAHYDFMYPGFKYNMMDLQAALGVHEMKKITQINARRKKIWDRYMDAFKDLPVTLPAPIPEHMTHARHLFTLLIDKKESGMTRDTFMQKLRELQVGSGIHFLPIHLSSYYKKRFKFKKGDFPNAEYIGERTVSLPSGHVLTDAEVGQVIEAVRAVFGKKDGTKSKK